MGELFYVRADAECTAAGAGEYDDADFVVTLKLKKRLAKLGAEL